MLEPVGSACNLRCVYCYQDPIRVPKNVMSEPILEKSISDALELGDKIRFLWHGGEPLLAGREFFQKAYDLQEFYKKPDQLIENHIQTNATLVNKEWARFLAKYGFKVGTSLDGPEHLHNLTRDRSYQKVIRGIKNIQATSNTVGVVITISTFNVDYPDEIWEKLILPKDLATAWEINICTSTETSSFTPSEEKSIWFLCRLFDLWLENDNPEIYIKTFRVVLRALMGANPGDCAFECNKCNLFLAIDELGDVYTCNRFLKREVAHLGNIKTQKLQDILNSEKAKTLYWKISGLKPECKNCKWLLACGGGCAFQRWMSTGRFDAGFPECKIRKALFSHIENKIKNG